MHIRYWRYSHTGLHPEAFPLPHQKSEMGTKQTNKRKMGEEEITINQPTILSFPHLQMVVTKYEHFDYCKNMQTLIWGLHTGSLAAQWVGLSNTHRYIYIYIAFVSLQTARGAQIIIATRLHSSQINKKVEGKKKKRLKKNIYINRTVH